MTIRTADAERDAALIARLARDIWTAHYTPIIGCGQVDYMLSTMQSETAIAGEIIDGRQYLVIEDGNGRATGYLAYDLHPTHLFLSKLYVLPSEQRRGIGARAIEHLLREHPGVTVRLTVNKHNQAAISFYEKSGFTRTGPAVTDIGNGFVMDDWIMEKSAASRT